MPEVNCCARKWKVTWFITASIYCRFFHAEVTTRASSRYERNSLQVPVQQCPISYAPLSLGGNESRFRVIQSPFQWHAVYGRLWGTSAHASGGPLVSAAFPRVITGNIRDEFRQRCVSSGNDRCAECRVILKSIFWRRNSEISSISMYSVYGDAASQLLFLWWCTRRKSVSAQHRAVG